jgi:hypothetical protein
MMPLLCLEDLKFLQQLDAVKRFEQLRSHGNSFHVDIADFSIKL